MTNALLTLHALDDLLNAKVELTLYGRAAFHLGFPEWHGQEFLQSRDVDAVLWIGQAEELNEKTNFWEVVEEVNRRLAERELYISHFFTENQVVLTSEWHRQRTPLEGDWHHLNLYRLGNIDLLLSKLMRNDPLDQNDALFLARMANLAGDRTAAEDLFQQALASGMITMRQDGIEKARQGITTIEEVIRNLRHNLTGFRLGFTRPAGRECSPDRRRG